jgi:hypothetical protein
MKSLVLASAFFTAVSILLTLTTTGSTDDCRPTGTHVNDTFGGACPDLQSEDITPISKTGNWNITWPDGGADGLTANGSGQCTVNLPCGLFRQPGHTVCWPAFYSPATTSNGSFSIFVENKVAQVENHPCPDIAPDRRVYCNTSGQTTFEKQRTCNWGGGSCQDLGQPCSSTFDCCSGFCGELSSTCVTCEPNPQALDEECMSEVCVSCYQQGGTYCTDDGGNCWTPIVIDVDGNGFNLTNATNGVSFNDGNGTLLRTAWTAANSDDSWLVLDRNGNGAIDDGTELFGNATPQPSTTELYNGFSALSEYDKTANGGNGDGLISNLDSIFVSLRLWRDVNHDGISAGSELYMLPNLGLASIDLNYKLSKYKDANGNTFKFRAKMKDSHAAQLGGWVYDVFLNARPAQ